LFGVACGREYHVKEGLVYRGRRMRTRMTRAAVIAATSPETWKLGIRNVKSSCGSTVGSAACVAVGAGGAVGVVGAGVGVEVAVSVGAGVGVGAGAGVVVLVRGDAVRFAGGGVVAFALGAVPFVAGGAV
jgi:hypothetical protein